MFKVKVSYLGFPTKIVLDHQEEEYRFEGTITVGELLSALAQRWDRDTRDSVFSSGGQLDPAVLVLVNGRSIGEMDGLNTRLQGDVDLSLALLGYPVGGG